MQGYRESWEDSEKVALESYPLYAGAEAPREIVRKQPEKLAGTRTKAKSGKRQMDIDSDFNFGKHNGKPLREVIEQHGGYISWLVDNEVVIFDQECMDIFADLKLI